MQHTPPMSSAPFRGSTLPSLGVGALVAAALLTVACATIADPDLWGHLRFGLDAVRSHTLARVDPYSYATDGQRWINHEWLAESLFALAWIGAGASGLIALKATVNALTFALLARRFTVLGVAPARTAILLCLLCPPLILSFFAQVRPQIFTFVAFAALLAILRRAESERRALWLVPPLFALWVNLHGGVLAGLGVLGLWCIAQALEDWPARWRLFWPALASALALLVNPYGPELVFFLARTATVPRPEIQDWLPLSLNSLLGAAYAVALGATAFGLIGTREPRRPTSLLLCGVAAVLPWLAVRHLPLFCLTAAFFAGEHVASAWQRFVARGAAGGDDPAAARVPPLAGALSFVAAVALLVLGALRGVYTQVHIVFEPPPATAVALLRDSGASGNLAVDFAWGEYAIWHLSPRIKVGMDGRRETAYSDLTYREFLDFDDGRNRWDAFLLAHPTDFALVRKGAPPDNLLGLTRGWRRIFSDERSVLFVREASPSAAAVIRVADLPRMPVTKKTFP